MGRREAAAATERGSGGSVMRVYLGGPINGCTDEEANGWRDAVKAVLAKRADYDWCDPMDRDYRGRELEPGIAAAIVEGDKEDIASCDVLLMNAPKPSYGTAMEILYGHQHSKRVIVIHPEGTTPSPWVIHHADEIHYGSAVAAAEAL
jgi:nucleoside 2-deoxyribosyltransferase